MARGTLGPGEVATASPVTAASSAACWCPALACTPAAAPTAGASAAGRLVAVASGAAAADAPLAAESAREAWASRAAAPWPAPPLVGSPEPSWVVASAAAAAACFCCSVSSCSCASRSCRWCRWLSACRVGGEQCRGEQVGGGGKHLAGSACSRCQPIHPPRLLAAQPAPARTTHLAGQEARALLIHRLPVAAPAGVHTGRTAAAGVGWAGGLAQPSGGFLPQHACVALERGSPVGQQVLLAALHLAGGHQEDEGLQAGGWGGMQGTYGSAAGSEPQAPARCTACRTHVAAPDAAAASQPLPQPAAPASHAPSQRPARAAACSWRPAPGWTAPPAPPQSRPWGPAPRRCGAGG